MSEARVAVIVDLVDSKRVTNRREVQREILAAFSVVDGHVNTDDPLRATVGDEFQAVYPTVAVALEATLLARLVLPEGIDCRFGLGRGDVVDVGDSVGGVIQDGSGWWLAREAINEAHRREDARTPSLRGWFRADGDDAGLEALVNAYLLSRDHIVGAMTARARRLTVGTMLGRLQGELAKEEGITQSAVSQALRRSGGGSLSAAIDELRRLAL
ncbi:SatD family protein [Glaciihabitans tibetensis]|nr:SatD family protein [Glaciihabitans tibetensis]